MAESQDNLQTTTQADLAEFRRVAEEVARAGGSVSKRYFARSIEVERKADKSPVTIADREAELEMRSILANKYPEHRIIGEEAGLSGSASSDYEWVLDPIDGTQSFIHRIPLYTVLVALVHKGNPVVGVIYNPQTEELVSAATGTGAWYNGKPTSVSTVASLGEARLYCSDPSNFFASGSDASEARSAPNIGTPEKIPTSNLQNITNLFSAVSLTRTWGDGHGYLMLATGRADVMIDPVMNYWDIASLMPIVREAGGTFTDIHGRAELGTSAIASNGRIHNEVLSIMSS